MRTRWLSLLLSWWFLNGPEAGAQDWEPGGLPLHGNYVRDLFTDAVNDALYATGYIEYFEGGSGDMYICRYQDDHWTTLGVFNQPVYNVVNYHDTLVASGLFTTVNGQACSGPAYFDGASWHQFGNFNTPVRWIRILNDTLYACDGFEEVEGQPAYGVAKLVGNAWVPPAPPPDSFEGVVTDVALYANELYVCGSFDFNGGLNDIMRFDGESWTDLDGSLLGGLTNASRMEVFNGKLIVGGQIYAQAGNAGNGVMAWDGSGWHSLGYGLSDENNTYNGVCTAWELVVHDGVLYVGGGFYHAGGVPAGDIASWDGEQWCNVGTTDFYGGVWSIGFYHDTLYVGTQGPVEGIDMNALVRWIGGAYADTCSLPTAIPMEQLETAAMQVSVRETCVEVRLPVGMSARDITLHDVQGRALKGAHGTTVRFTAPCSTGLYIVRAEGFLPVRVLVP